MKKYYKLQGPSFLKSQSNEVRNIIIMLHGYGSNASTNAGIIKWSIWTRNVSVGGAFVAEGNKSSLTANTMIINMANQKAGVACPINAMVRPK